MTADSGGLQTLCRRFLANAAQLEVQSMHMALCREILSGGTPTRGNDSRVPLLMTVQHLSTPSAPPPYCCASLANVLILHEQQVGGTHWGRRATPYHMSLRTPRADIVSLSTACGIPLLSVLSPKKCPILAGCAGSFPRVAALDDDVGVQDDCFYWTYSHPSLVSVWLMVLRKCHC